VSLVQQEIDVIIVGVYDQRDPEPLR